MASDTSEHIPEKTFRKIWHKAGEGGGRVETSSMNSEVGKMDGIRIGTGKMTINTVDGRREKYSPLDTNTILHSAHVRDVGIPLDSREFRARRGSDSPRSTPPQLQSRIFPAEGDERGSTAGRSSCVARVRETGLLTSKPQDEGFPAEHAEPRLMPRIKTRGLWDSPKPNISPSFPDTLVVIQVS